jgi:hypothetical protein
MMEPLLIPIIAIVTAIGCPTSLLGLHLIQRHRQKMRALETQAGAHQLAALESSRAELELRVRTLESIVTSPDRDLEARLRRLEASTAPPSLPPRS